MLPQHLIINSLQFYVNRVPDLKNDEGDGLMGRTTFGNIAIEIEQKLDPQMQLMSLVHESLHVMLWQAGFGEQDEQHITTLGYGVYALIRNNPDLVRAIQAGVSSADRGLEGVDDIPI